MQKHEVFSKEIETISTLERRTITCNLVDNLPEYFFKIPASSTGKYHPLYALGVGGLVRHTKAAAKIAINLLSLDQYKKEFRAVERDAIIAALVIHDGYKCGLEHSEYTVTKHPIICAEMVGRYQEENQSEFIELVKNNVLTHMGEFVTDYKTKEVVLEQPQTESQKFVHMCDYLASRKYIAIDFEDDIYNESVIGSIEFFTEIDGVIFDIISEAKKKIQEGCSREAIYTIIENVCGVHNPRNIYNVNNAREALRQIRGL